MEYSTKQRLFNLGYFIFGIIIFVSELNFFKENQDMIHLASAALWLVQVCLSIPNKLGYDGSQLAKSAGIKIYASLSVINFYGIVIVQYLEVPNVAIYFHALLAVLPIVSIYLILANKIAITKE